jgi:nitrite reductase/ring-hydroxylating ferredoxin subunit/DMSO/TMAO reductase YedYZ heme-binding membrane subunit
MVNSYRAVVWTKQKLLVDLALVSGSALYLVLFVSISLAGAAKPDYAEMATMLLRGFSTLALLLLHAVLAIGPLSRLHPAFVPLIQHRRHLGVFTFLVALAHGVLATGLHHWGGELNPLASILLGNRQLGTPREWPFEIFGLLALLILAALASTSHDFWLSYLSPRLWKRLHMLVYAAYALVVLHVALGYLQEARNPVYALLLAGGATGLVVLHRLAALRERRMDEAPQTRDAEGWVRVCPPAEIPMGRARVVMAGGERIAVFRYWQGISAVSNVCPHQGGPLGEGAMVAGCVRCPWHGTLFFPQSGMAPAPYEHRVQTFPVKLVEGCVYVNPRAYPLGTETEPLPVPGQKGKATPTAAHMSLERGVVTAHRPGLRSAPLTPLVVENKDVPRQTPGVERPPQERD